MFEFKRKQKILLILSVTIFLLGCQENQQYVCMNGEKVDHPTSCPTSSTTSSTLLYVGLRPECLNIKNFEGELDLKYSIECSMEKGAPPEICNQLQYLSESGMQYWECISKFGSIRNDSRICSLLNSNQRIICEAISTKNSSLCLSVGNEKLRNDCLKRTKISATEALDCSLKSGESFVWCIINSNPTPVQCLSIDDTIYVDESVFCYAVAEKNEASCKSISDQIMRNLCIRRFSVK
jgi:hypothetical protein